MRLRFHLLLLTTLTLLSLSSTLTSARFILPNITSIPPWLNTTDVAGAWSTFLNLTGCQLGENLTGISKLKQYFHHFGYIPNAPPSNFTDDFDDILESAIKTYQRNFNIDVTGQLDLKTLQQIIKPRCGNSDIVNGTTTMNSKKSTTTSLHSVAHYSFFPGAPRWPESRRDLTYAFFPGNQLSDTVKGVFTRAFQRWAQVIPMTFTETSDFNNADIRIGFFQGDHGDGEPFDGVFGTLAHAFSPPSGRFHLDGDENWVVSGDEGPPRFSSAVDLESVAVHEIGHLLGLGHSSIEDSIMYPTITSGMKKVELHSDDIDGIQSLYGSNPNFNGSTTSAGGERDTAGSNGASGSAFRVGFGALVAVGSALLLVL